MRVRALLSILLLATLLLLVACSSPTAAPGDAGSGETETEESAPQEEAEAPASEEEAAEEPAPSEEEAATEAGDEGAAQSGGTLRSALRTDPLMNPIWAFAADDVIFNQAVFDMLVRFDRETLSPGPALAERWEASEDGLTWTFYLRDDVTWHDGVPFTAEDVAFHYNSILDPETNARWASNFEELEEVEVIDDYTVAFHLSSPVASFPVLVGFSQGIVPKHVLEGRMTIEGAADFNQAMPIGTGPFKVVEVAQGDHVTLEANEDYFEGRPQLDRIIFKILPDVNTQVAQIMGGELDLVIIEPVNVPTVQGVPGIRIDEAGWPVFYHVSFHQDFPIFQDKQVRHALRAAIDLDGIIQNVVGGQALPGTGPIAPVMADWYNSELEPHTYDPDAARAMLEEAGWQAGSDGVLEKDGERLAFALLADNNPLREQLAVILEQQFEAVGAEVTLEVREWADYVERILAHDFEAYVGFFNLSPDPDQSAYYGTGGFYNLIDYSNPEMDELLQQGRQEMDPEKRKQIYNEYQELWMEEAPGVMLFYPNELRVVSEKLRGLPSIHIRDAMQYVHEFYFEQ